MNFNYWLAKVPDDLELTEAVFHIDSFTKR